MSCLKSATNNCVGTMLFDGYCLNHRAKKPIRQLQPLPKKNLYAPPQPKQTVIVKTKEQVEVKYIENEKFVHFTSVKKGVLWRDIIN